MIAGGIMSPTDSVLGIATSTVAPAVSFRVGQYFKGLAEENKRQGITEEAELTTSQQVAHIATHAIIGAITAQTNGGNALSGALSAGGAEALAPMVARILYGDEAKPENLTAEQKQTILTITQAVGAVSGSLNGDSSLDAYVGANVANSAVDNNYLTAKQWADFVTRFNQCKTQQCRNQVAQESRALNEKQDKIFAGADSETRQQLIENAVDRTAVEDYLRANNPTWTEEQIKRQANEFVLAAQYDPSFSINYADSRVATARPVELTQATVKEARDLLEYLKGGKGGATPAAVLGVKGNKGKKASNSSKNEAHGDAGRAMEKAKKANEKLQQKLDQGGLSRAERQRIEKKMQRNIETAQSKSKGENHSMKGK